MVPTLSWSLFRVSVLLLNFVNISVGEATHMVFSFDAKSMQPMPSPFSLIAFSV